MFFMRGYNKLCHAFFIAKAQERRSGIMNYKEMYFELFNKITDIIETLKEIQKEMEEKYIESPEEE